MTLPIVPLPLAERWDCHQCGFCCRGSNVPLDDMDLQLLEEQGWQQRPEFRHVQVTTPRRDGRRGQQLNQRPDGACVFLQADGLCQIHKEFGFDAKPLICRMFPLQLVLRENEAVLTVRRACPSAAADQGRLISEYLPAVRANAAERGLIDWQGGAPPIKSGEVTHDWKRSRIVLEALRRLTNDDRYPPVRRLAHGVELCRLLEQATIGQFDHAQLSELVQVLEAHVVAEAAPHFANRTSPQRMARTLFRQTALDVVRLHPKYKVQPTWSSRLRMAGWAFRMARGKGVIPQIHAEFPQPLFADLEQPLGQVLPEIHQALGRYFETATASYEYALAAREGWSVIESYRQLALLHPLALWLLRWASSGRTATPTDMHHIIVALDRSQAYAPLAGARQRGMIRSLVQMQQLPKLLAWYGR